MATQPKSPLAPGETTHFTISYRTTLRGQAHKRVTLTTNDPSQPSVVIPVTGTVRGVFDISPTNSIIFRTVDAESAATEAVTLKNICGQPLSLHLQDGQDFGPFAIELKEVEPGMEYTLTATTKPPLQAGVNRATVKLETGFAESPELTLSVIANVQPRVSAAPRQLIVHPSQKAGSLRWLRVQYRADHPIHILDVRANFPGMMYEPMAPASGPAHSMIAAHQIRLTLPAFDDIPDTDAKIEILTDDPSPEFQTLEIPVLKRAKHTRSGSEPEVSGGEPEGVPSREALRQKLDEALRRANAAGQSQEPATQPAAGKRPQP